MLVDQVPATLLADNTVTRPHGWMWLLLLCGLKARASTLTVSSTADSGSGTLRAQIAAAAPGDTINFSVTGTITLTSGAIGIDQNLTIAGPGASSLTVNGPPV